MVTVYQLRRDKRHTEWTGIAKWRGIAFGSEEWWQSIASGKLPVHTLRGVITRVSFPSPGMGDWPEFRMRSDDGRESSWTPYSNGQALSEFYQVGQRIEIDYVLQRHRLYSRTRGFDFKRHKIMIEVRIGTMPNKSPEPTAVGACSSAVAVHVTSRRWLSFFR